MTSARRVDEWLHRFRARLIHEELDEIRESVVKRLIMLPIGLEPCEQRWRTMHALGHIDLHVGNQRWMLLRGLEWQVQKQEQQAERWAAQRLIPLNELEQLIDDGLDMDDLAEAFDVPPAGLDVAFRLLQEQYERDAAQCLVPESEALDAFHFEPLPLWERCLFCADVAPARYQIRASNEPASPGILRAPLCAEHEQLLYDAADSGRVYAGTGVRYWLLDR